MLPDASDIDAAILATLSGDATLQALAPQGVWFDEAPAGSKAFVIVSLVDERDEEEFGQCAYEDALYAVTFRELKTPNGGSNAKAAAARIHALLEDQPLTVSGYSWMTIHREQRLRQTEVDAVDASIRWNHRGGHYRVMFSRGA
jgi:hypothetical protein